MRIKRALPALGAFFVLAAAVSGCGSGIPGNSVAVVAGNPISTQAFNHWIYILAKSQAAQAPGEPVIVPNDPPNFTRCIAQVRAEIPSLKKTGAATLKADCQRVFTQEASSILGYLITAYWYQADAHKLGIKLSDAQVQKALATARKGQFSTATQFNSYLKATGQTLADVTYRVKISQIFSKLVARHPTTVTQQAIATYYNNHRSLYGTPEMRNLRIVLAKSSALAQAAKTALQHGASWPTVVKKYSIDPTTKSTGGLLTDVTKGQEDAALSTAAFAATPNHLLGPIKGQFGYYIVDVLKITPATTRSLAQSSPLIKSTLANQLQNNASTAVTNQAKKDWLSKTTCRALYAMNDCRGYKAPSSATLSTTGSAPASP